MHSVILAQTDTTVGFLSQDSHKLARIKERPGNKPFIQSFDSLRRYSAMGGRVPRKFKNRLRQAKATSFVINNRAIRIVADGEHHQLLKKFGWFYSTSANAKGCSFDRAFAEAHADIIIEDNRGLYEGEASSIYRLNRKKIKQLR
ncbi:Sua5/YciO/YrdC/YwlC family protein [Sulfurimonas sp. HSL3-7]|uniref:Sua5/YciO/YrdC/YwlC family protein n=1 Tax=Sulfonitrofixus jiaomeiensis TaxID=3131938 RepID=UPI0031F9C752